MPSMQEQLERLTRQKRGKGGLRPATARQPIGPDVSTARPTTDDPLGGSGGIESPLTEQPGTRTYHTTEHEIVSTSGFYVLGYFAVNTVTFLDAGENEVQLVFDDTA